MQKKVIERLSKEYGPPFQASPQKVLPKSRDVFARGHEYFSLIFLCFYLLWIIPWNLGELVPK